MSVALIHEQNKFAKFFKLKNSLKKEILSFSRFPHIMSYLQFINKTFLKIISEMEIVNYIKKNINTLFDNSLIQFCRSGVYEFNQKHFRGFIDDLDNLDPTYFILALFHKNKRFFEIEDFLGKQNNIYNFICFTKEIRALSIGPKTTRSQDPLLPLTDIMLVLGNILKHNKNICVLDFTNYFTESSYESLNILKDYLNVKMKNQIISLKIDCLKISGKRQCLMVLRDLLVENNYIKYLELGNTFFPEYLLKEMEEDDERESNCIHLMSANHRAKMNYEEEKDSLEYDENQAEKSKEEVQSEYFEFIPSQDNIEASENKSEQDEVLSENSHYMGLQHQSFESNGSENIYDNENLSGFDFLKEVLKHNKNITHLGLPKTYILMSDHYLNFFKEIIENNNSITHLDLQNLTFSRKNIGNKMQTLKEIISKKQNLEEISISLDVLEDFSEISSLDFIQAISEMLENLKNLKRISLHDLKLSFDPNAIIIVKNVLLNRNNLITLDLSNILYSARLGGYTFSFIFGPLKEILDSQKNLKKFYFRFNHFGESRFTTDYFNDFTEVIIDNKSIKSLYLGGNFYKNNENVVEVFIKLFQTKVIEEIEIDNGDGLYENLVEKIRNDNLKIVKFNNDDFNMNRIDQELI